MAAKDDPARILLTSTAREFLVAKDRANRFVFRLKQIAVERAATWAGDRIGMTSFAEAGPALVALEDDVSATIAGIVEGRYHDRERGETEVPLVAALESVLERVKRAHRVSDLRDSRRAPPEWAEPRFASLVADALRRLAAFGEVYDAKRIVAMPAETDVLHLLQGVETDAAIDRVQSVVTTPPEPKGPAAIPPPPRILTAADALDDLLRAARGEVPAALPPWRVTPSSPTTPLVLSIGAIENAAGQDPAPAPALGGDPARFRTDRAASVLTFAHGVEVVRALAPDGATAGIALRLEDRSASAVAGRLPPGAALSPAADAAVRAYLVAMGKASGEADPQRLVAAMGLFKAVERELERVLLPALSEPGARVVASGVPREDSRKAPVRREVVATLSAAFADFPAHRVNDVLDAIAHGKPTAVHAKPPDAAVVLAVLGRRWPNAGGYGARVLPLGSLSDEDLLASVKDVIALHAIRQALERGRDPGERWGERMEAAAFGLLARLARAGSGTPPTVR